jgi:hypothetical protein
MPPSDIDRVVRESSRKLLQVSVPPVKYWVLLNTLDMDIDDPIVQRTVSECRTFPPRVRLLESLGKDGTWPISKSRKIAEDAGPGPPVGWTFVTMLRNLEVLDDMCTSRSEGNIDKVVERILNWQRKDGSILGPKHNIFPMPNYNGYALWDLLLYGMHGDPRVGKLADWLINMQRHDGGWAIPYQQDVKYLPEYRYVQQEDFLEQVRKGETPRSDPKGYRDIPSCIWTTMMVVRGLSRSKKYRSLPAVRKGADFILDRFFRRNNHESYYRSEKHWTRLKYPPYLGNGLSALYLLTRLGYGPSDERMEGPIEWLIKARHPDGFWWQSHKPCLQKDQWISGFAVEALHRYLKNG